MRYILLNLAFLCYVLFGGKPESAKKPEQLAFMRRADTLHFENASHNVRTWKKESAIACGDSLYFIKGAFVTKAFVAPSISLKVFTADKLWLARGNGLFFIPQAEDRLHPLPLPAR
jgi:hypothetical protein